VPTLKEQQDQLTQDLIDARWSPPPETLERVPTPQLRLGDIVLSYGMRILLDTPAKIWHSSHGCDHGPDIMTHEKCRLAYSWLGTVTNPSEVEAGGSVPLGWMHYDTYPGEHRWNVQGNDLATWTVERSVTAV
jgi:hypothetical protein